MSRTNYGRFLAVFTPRSCRREGSPGHNGVVESQVKPIRVVIVDDNPEFLDSARRLLEHQGVRVAGVASTNADGLRSVQELRPDVTLVDVNIGEECGFDLAEALHEIDGAAAAPVILI